jgi:hypothetical protein
MRKLLSLALAASLLAPMPAIMTAAPAYAGCWPAGTVALNGDVLEGEVCFGSHVGNPSGDLAAKLRAERLAAEQPAPTPEPDCYIIPGQVYYGWLWGEKTVTIGGITIKIPYRFWGVVGQGEDTEVCEGDEGYEPPAL